MIHIVPMAVSYLPPLAAGALWRVKLSVQDGRNVVVWLDAEQRLKVVHKEPFVTEAELSDEILHRGDVSIQL